MSAAAKIQVLSCGCICRKYDGKIVVVGKRCTWHTLARAAGDPE